MVEWRHDGCFLRLVKNLLWNHSNLQWGSHILPHFRHGWKSNIYNSQFTLDNTLPSRWQPTGSSIIIHGLQSSHHQQFRHKEVDSQPRNNPEIIETIGHFRVPKTLTFKMRLSAQPFLWKWVLFAWEWKIISISKAEHLTSFLYRGPGELGNGLFNLPTLFTKDFTFLPSFFEFEVDR